jgi:hypothetical protein
MQSFGRLLQVLGLVIVPMALVYYIAGRGQVCDSKLMFGELTILAVGALLFLIGKALLGKQ